MPSYTLKCKCGAFKATFDAAPHINFNCHCRSCVAACKAIEAKEGFDGISIRCDNSGGVAVAIFKSNNVFIKEADASKIGFMKVGERGKWARSYCTECKTVLFNGFFPNRCGANRNALTETEGGEPFTPDDAVINILGNYAFDSERVPVPKHGAVPFGIMLKFIPLIVGWGCDGRNANEKALIPEDMTKVEACTITWE
ncbi:hypothetical protein ACHAWX_000181 [Stephanocyclus meneghinianus]